MTAPAVRILVVDDEPAIRRLLRTGLGTQGYAVAEAASGVEAARQVGAADLVILDLGLPDTSGQELLARWRAAGNAVPVVILSSRDDEAGIVEALDLGADDYVTKPFGMRELVARIRTALRHRLQSEGAQPIFRSGNLAVDLVRRVVRVDGAEVGLTPREYEILRVLAQNAGKVLTHRFLIRQVWGGIADVQNLRVHIRQLRQKIEPDPQRPTHIRTETGIGYRLHLWEAST
ncbi:response regulator transcription factor [uncultured Amaricoccus sp.]|uniref:response regulator transcription factor n=1 Tax=uncultured Amaricoccus sp. TaxID=339341 RepID=UPI0026188988|nr:response regulator transcription factor [uncultured Amaricoccus sp.]